MTPLAVSNITPSASSVTGGGEFASKLVSTGLFMM